MEEMPELQRLWGGHAMEKDGGLARVLELVRQPSVLNRARILAADQTAIARERLAAISASEFRDSLTLLIEEQILRDR
jgi:hypothetical protein